MTEGAPELEPTRSPRRPLRCLLGFHERAKRSACSKGVGPLRFCQHCLQPMEKTPNGDWRVTRS
jgi:hypothetical protein